MSTATHVKKVHSEYFERAVVYDVQPPVEYTDAGSSTKKWTREVLIGTIRHAGEYFETKVYPARNGRVASWLPLVQVERETSDEDMLRYAGYEVTL